MVFRNNNGISFRKLEEKDLELLKELKDSTWMSTHHVSILNMWNQKNWFEWLSSNDRNFVFVAYEETESDVVSVGPFGIFKVFTIDWVNGTADIGYDVFDGFRKRGLGREWLLLERSCAKSC